METQYNSTYIVLSWYIMSMGSTSAPRQTDIQVALAPLRTEDSKCLYIYQKQYRRRMLHTNVKGQDFDASGTKAQSLGRPSEPAFGRPSKRPFERSTINTVMHMAVLHTCMCNQQYHHFRVGPPLRVRMLSLEECFDCCSMF